MSSQLHPRFVRRWIRLNTIAFVLSYLVYTPIAHGVTGPHGRALTTPQLVAHCVALAVVGLFVFSAQRRALTPFFEVGRVRLALGVASFITFFWIGYYQTLVEGPDADILLGYLALGTAGWLGRVPMRGHPIAALVALFAFPFASFVGELLLFVVVATFDVEVKVMDPFFHSLFWLTVGTTTGLLGGWLSGKALSRMLTR